VQALGQLVSDDEVERAVERIRNPRAQGDPSRAVMDGFLQQLSHDPGDAEAPVTPYEPPLTLPPAPSQVAPPSVSRTPSRPLTPAEFELATVAGVASATSAGSGPAASAPPAAPTPPPAAAPPSAPGGPVFDISASVGQAGTNRPDDVRGLSQRLIALGFNWLTPDDQINVDKIAAIRLFQAIKNGHATVAGHAENDGLVEVGKNTHRWLQATNAPRWQIMPAGSASEGFENSERADTASAYDYGTNWLAAAITGAGAGYKRDHLDSHAGAAMLTVNDTSLPRGVPQPGETALHAGHQTGLELDLRLPRTDGRAGQVTHADALYDRDAMRAMLRALRANGAVTVLFNDSVLIGEGLCTQWAKHDDHVHVRIRPPQQGPIEIAGVAGT
jgi:hypothetical protein